MARASIPETLRAVVIERAHQRCEYCHRPDDDNLNAYPHEIDHVIAKKHGGDTVSMNLAYACFDCNRYKGSDIASIDPLTTQISPLFHPRTNEWHHHFRLSTDGTLVPLTAEGRATVFLLKLNDLIRIQIRVRFLTAKKLEVGQE